MELGLSIVYIDTDDGDYIQSRVEWSPSSMHIVLSEDMREYTNIYTKGSLPVRIKGRGNSTWSYGYPDGKEFTQRGDTHTRKVPYNLKLSKKTDLFGLGKSKRWVLVSNYMERTFMRNKLIYELSGKMGMIYTKSVFVNLVLNGEYMGVYMLSQKVDTGLFGGKATNWDGLAEDLADQMAANEQLDDTERQAIENDLKTDLTWVTTGSYHGHKLNLEGCYPYTGYLIEYDEYADEPSFFKTSHGVPLKVKNMDYVKSNRELFSYLNSYFYYFEEALYSDTFYNSAGKHYSEYLDMSSFVDYYILNAVILNVELGYKSMFMHLSDDGKLVLAPCWDYDWSSGNPFLRANGDYNCWYNDYRAVYNHWYHQLYGDPWFVALVRERWFEVLDMVNDMVESIDGLYAYLAPTVRLEYEKFLNDPYEIDLDWRIDRRTFHVVCFQLKQFLLNREDHVDWNTSNGRTFLDECTQLKQFLRNRVDWMTEQFYLRDPNIENRGLISGNSFKLALTGASSTLSQSNNNAGFVAGDLVSDVFQDIQISVTSAKDDDFKVFLNGEFLYEKTIKAQNGNFTFTAPTEKFTNGVNVIMVIKNLSREGQDVMYASVNMPGVKPRIPSVNDDKARKADKGDRIMELVPSRIAPEGE